MQLSGVGVRDRRATNVLLSSDTTGFGSQGDTLHQTEKTCA